MPTLAAVDIDQTRFVENSRLSGRSLRRDSRDRQSPAGRGVFFVPLLTPEQLPIR